MFLDLVHTLYEDCGKEDLTKTTNKYDILFYNCFPILNKM